ncbi:MAG: cell division protein FtsQ/DivIB [Pseudomonadota bacterium]
MTKPQRKASPAKARKKTTAKKAPARKPFEPMKHIRIAGYVFAGAAVLSVVALAALFVDFRALPGQIVDGTREVVRFAGFKAEDITVRGAQRFTYQQIQSLAQVDADATIFGQDLEAIQARLEQQTWIKAARVSRHLPGRLMIDVEEHQAFARWQRGGKFYLIDDQGAPFMKISRSEWRDLPIVVGEGANASAGRLQTALAQYPYLSSRLSSATWIGARRWDLWFEGGVLVRLPEEQLTEKLGQLSRMQMRDGILAAGPMRIDMRMDHMLAISTDPDSFTPKPRPRRAAATKASARAS